MGNKKGPSLIPKSSAQEKKTSYINKSAAFINSHLQDGDKATVFISLRLVQNNFQCFSEWTKPEMDAFWSFNRDIHLVTWSEIKQQGGKGANKAGYGPTVIDKSQYKGKGLIDDLDPNTTFLELRVTQKIRVHGFRDSFIFYICWLDKDHEICD